MRSGMRNNSSLQGAQAQVAPGKQEYNKQVVG